MDTVRLVRDLGTADHLIPDGVDGLTDLPYPLFDAIRGAMVFLSFDNLPEKDTPPRRMWGHPRMLRDWFDAVDERNKREYDRDPIDDPVENEAAAALISG